jgi:hypothetical protein
MSVLRLAGALAVVLAVAHGAPKAVSRRDQDRVAEEAYGLMHKSRGRWQHADWRYAATGGAWQQLTISDGPCMQILGKASGARPG